METKINLGTIIVIACWVLLALYLFVWFPSPNVVQAETVSGNETEVTQEETTANANYKFTYYHGDIPSIKVYNVISTTEGEGYTVYNLDSGDVLKCENNCWTLWHDNMPIFQYTGIAYMEYVKPN